MTLNEAIQHAEEKSKDCDKCSEEHKQLATWLKELRDFKQANIAGLVHSLNEIGEYCIILKPTNNGVVRMYSNKSPDVWLSKSVTVSVQTLDENTTNLVFKTSRVDNS